MSLPITKENDMHWITPERVNWLVGVALSALVGFGAGNGHTTQHSIDAIADKQGQTAAQLHHVQSVVVPTLKKELTAAKGVATSSKTQPAQSGTPAPN